MIEQPQHTDLTNTISLWSQVLPLMDSESFMQAMQMIDIYTRTYAFGPSDYGVSEIVADCPGSGNAMAEAHQKVIDVALHIAHSYPKSMALLSQLSCAMHPVLVNPEFVNERSQLGVLRTLQTAFAAVLEVGQVGLARLAFPVVSV
jgi:hypothetical protein